MIELTPDQIKHWRSALCLSLGTYAFIMPDLEIQKVREKLQNQLNERDRKDPTKPIFSGTTALSAALKKAGVVS